MIWEYLKVIGLGIIAIAFHWKTILFWGIVIFVSCIMFFEQGLLAALFVVPIAWALNKLGQIL